jgi:hypothetical protein
MRALARGVVAALTVTRALAQEPDKDSAGYVLEHCQAWLNRDSGMLTDSYSQGACVGKIEGVLRVVAPPTNDYEICLASSKFGEGVCVGRNDAYGFMFFNSQQRFSRQANGICLPDRGRTANDQIVRVVVKYIDARPERIHERFRFSSRKLFTPLGRAIRNFRPCSLWHRPLALGPAGWDEGGGAGNYGDSAFAPRRAIVRPRRRALLSSYCSCVRGLTWWGQSLQLGNVTDNRDTVCQAYAVYFLGVGADSNRVGCADCAVLHLAEH